MKKPFIHIEKEKPVSINWNLFCVYRLCFIIVEIYFESGPWLSPIYHSFNI